MLRKENVGFQSICNGVGLLAGLFIGNFRFNYLFLFIMNVDYFDPSLN